MNRMLAILMFALIAVAAAAETPKGGGGVGDLLVAPTRVVFDDRTRTAEIALLNTGTQSTTYRISFRHMRMNESGQLVEVDAPDGERFADSYLLYTPRQVTLEPRVSQTVRVRLRLPEDAADGEYRSHLEFRGLPPDDLNDARADDGKVAIRVVPIYGVSIPLLVRRGATAAELAIEDLAVRSGGEATLVLRRSGTRSTHGNLVARFLPHGASAEHEQVVGTLNGVAIYLPLGERRVTIPLRAPLRNGTLRVTYADADGTAGTPPVEAQLVLP